MKYLAINRRARYDFEIVDTLSAGIELTGAETKSIKLGHVSLKGSFVTMRSGEAYLNNAHVTPYLPSGNRLPQDPTRSRKLLLHRKQLDHLQSERSSGMSPVPMSLFVQRRYIKLEIGIGRGKKRYDKRAAIKTREQQIEVRRSLKN